MSEMNDDVYARIMEELSRADEWLYRGRRTIARAQRSYAQHHDVHRVYAKAARELRAASTACNMGAMACQKASVAMEDDNE